MSPQQDKLQQRLRPLVLAAMASESPYEMAKGFLRYEAVRKLNAPDFNAITARCLSTDEPFDDVVDELILKQP